MDHGPWTMVHGPWSMDHGPWSMDHAPWSMVHGPWSMVGATSAGDVWSGRKRKAIAGRGLGVQGFQPMRTPGGERKRARTSTSAVVRAKCVPIKVEKVDGAIRAIFRVCTAIAVIVGFRLAQFDGPGIHVGDQVIAVRLLGRAYAFIGLVSVPIVIAVIPTIAV